MWCYHFTTCANSIVKIIGNVSLVVSAVVLMILVAIIARVCVDEPVLSISHISCALYPFAFSHICFSESSVIIAVSNIALITLTCRSCRDFCSFGRFVWYVFWNLFFIIDLAFTNDRFEIAFLILGFGAKVLRFIVILDGTCSVIWLSLNLMVFLDFF